ncbi:polysaccharide pyruvyl transferase family protein [Novosphingobium resinovorum]|uniref:polysaccharide pyruvyl transferase family protein n=1 Tax=Novosphingobium resinovorum TaxID=158500 RepID=UPI002ED4F155|nr:polysaccharide pyruvyl transferase family protein [Novosphingobium resinovorum]
MRLLRYRPSAPNFGDDLNTELWPALVPSLFANETDEGEDAFVGIGTIVGIDPGPSRNLHVFSSGVGYTAIDAWSGRAVEFHCVRGPVTARVLGVDPDRALTDGAILTTAIDRYRALPQECRERTVVVPHYETIAFPGWEEAVRMAGFDLVDPRTAPEAVIRKVSGSRLVLTESLHGAILADAFGVPWRAFGVSRNFSTAKWADWTGSLGMRAQVVLLPPPDAIQLFRFGKRPEPFGAIVALDQEVAYREFRARITSNSRASFMKRQAKGLLEALPVARRTLGFSVERTARALMDLSAMPPFLSDAYRRAMLRDEMLERLHGVARRYGAGLAVTG